MNPDNELVPRSDVVVLVTAAAGVGVGQAVARRFAATGATVVVTDAHAARTQSVAEAIAADHPTARVLSYPLDVGCLEAIDSVVQSVVSSCGPISVLVNNAAYNVRSPIDELSV